eukprot:146505_1
MSSSPSSLTTHYIHYLVAVLSFSVVRSSGATIIDSYELIGTNNVGILSDSTWSDCKATCEGNVMCNYFSHGQLYGYRNITCIMYTSYHSLSQNPDVSTATYMCTDVLDCCTVDQLTNNDYCSDPTRNHTTFAPVSTDTIFTPQSTDSSNVSGPTDYLYTARYPVCVFNDNSTYCDYSKTSEVFCCEYKRFIDGYYSYRNA